MPTDNYVQVDADGVGKKVDTEDLTVNGQEVQRERTIAVPGSLPHGCDISHLVSASGTNATVAKNAPGNWAQLPSQVQAALGKSQCQQVMRPGLIWNWKPS